MKTNFCLKFIVSFLLLIFSALSNLVTHTSSIILTLLILMGIPVMFSSQKRPSLTQPEKLVLWAFVAFSGAYLFSFAVRGLSGDLIDPRLSNIDHELRFLSIIPIFMLLRYIKVSQGILWGSILSGAFVSGAYAIISFLFLLPGERVPGSYHPITFGDISLALAFMSIASLEYFLKKGFAYRFIPLAAFVFGLIASILSGTRGSWIAVPVLIGILYSYTATILKTRTRLLLVGSFCLSAIVVYITPQTMVAGRIDALVTEIVAYRQGDRTYSSTASRLDGYRTAWVVFSQNPILGAGPGNCESYRQQMKERGDPYPSATAHCRPHGDYPATMADCGIIGFLALLGVFAIPLWSSIGLIRKGKMSLGYTMLMFVVAFMHFGLTAIIFAHNVYISFYVIMVAAILAVSANEENTEKHPAI